MCEQAVAGTCNANSGACEYPICDGDALACEDATSGTCNAGACEYELNCPASGASECEDGDAATCEDDGTCTVRPFAAERCLTTDPTAHVDWRVLRIRHWCFAHTCTQCARTLDADAVLICVRAGNPSHNLQLPCLAQHAHSGVCVQYGPVANTPAKSCSDGDDGTVDFVCVDGACVGTPEPTCIAEGAHCTADEACCAGALCASADGETAGVCVGAPTPTMAGQECVADDKGGVGELNSACYEELDDKGKGAGKSNCGNNCDGLCNYICGTTGVAYGSSTCNNGAAPLRSSPIAPVCTCVVLRCAAPGWHSTSDFLFAMTMPCLKSCAIMCSGRR